MQLTQFTDYSIRALIYIAVRDEICTIQDITKAYNISNHHMVKIIHNLSKLGFIKTNRGKGGGITMAVSPTEINLGKIVNQIEPSFDLVPCFNKEKSNCCIAPVCKLKTILFEAKTGFVSILDRYTLADILSNKQELKELLTHN